MGKALTIFAQMTTLSGPLAHQIPNNLVLKIDTNPFFVKHYFMKFRKLFK